MSTVSARRRPRKPSPVQTAKPAPEPEPKRDLRAAVKAGFFILSAPGCGTVELYGDTGRVLRYDPTMPEAERALRVAEILGTVCQYQTARVEILEKPQPVSTLALRYAATSARSAYAATPPGVGARGAGILAATIDYGGDDSKRAALAWHCTMERTVERVRADGLGAHPSGLVRFLDVALEVSSCSVDSFDQVTAEYSEHAHPIECQALEAMFAVEHGGPEVGRFTWSPVFVAFLELAAVVAHFDGDPGILDAFALDFVEELALARLSD